MTEKSGGSILERAVGMAPDRSASVSGSMLERAAARSGTPAPRPMSYAEAQAAPAAAAAAQPVDHASASTAASERREAFAAIGPAARAPASASTSPTARGGRRGTIDFEALAARGYVTPDGSQSLTAEEFRLVKRQLLANAAARGPGAMKNANLILVGSAMPHEGKTYVAINLALSIAAERDLTVMLVDADVAKPEVVNQLGLENGPGLIDVVADRNIDLGDCLIRTQIPNLTVLPAGRPHTLSPELFASERMDDLIQEVARRYTDRIVIFDSPPALVSSAASVLATHVGQVVFVVAAESTREADLREGLALMGGCPNVQLLLNRSRFFPAGRRFVAQDYGA